MAEKKKKQPKAKKSTKVSKKSTKSKGKKSKKTKEEPISDDGIIIVEEDLSIDKDKENEERKAYLEEARSQESFDD